MAALLRQRRVDTRRLCDERRQLLEFTLLHWSDNELLQPPVDLASIDLNGLNVRALLEREEGGGDIDLRSEEFLYRSAADEGDKVELVSEFKLVGAQLSLAAYETMLLFMRGDRSVGKPDFGELCDEIRLNLMISTKQHKIVMSNLDVNAEALPAGMRDQPINPTSLHYRLQMLAGKLPHEFADDSAFEMWQERQMAVFMIGLHSEFDAIEFAQGEPIAEVQACEDLFQKMLDISRPDQGRIVTRKSEGFPSAEYTQCIDQINSFLCNIIYPRMAVGRRGTECDAIPHSYPLNTILYGKLFETCFDSSSRGSFSENGERTLALLTTDSFRHRLQITEQMHFLSYAHALCSELSESSSIELMPVLKEQIFCITPQMVIDDEELNPPPVSPGHAGSAQRLLVHTEKLHRAAMLQKLRKHFKEVLFNYHSYHENVARIEAYLDVYTRGLEGPITGGDPDPERLLSEMIASGVVSGYNALAGMLERPMHVTDLSGIVEECFKQLQVELEHFSPVFMDLHPSPDAMYINLVTRLISQDHAGLLPLNAIDDDVMDCLKLMERFDDYVIAYAQREGTRMDESEVTPMLQHSAVYQMSKDEAIEAFQRAPLSGLLWQWMYQQENNFSQFTDRLLELEVWEPVCDGVHHSTSVTDMFSMFQQTMEFFFKLELGVPEFLNHLLGAVVACMMKYGNLMKVHQADAAQELEISWLQQQLVSQHESLLCRPVRLDSANKVPEHKHEVPLPSPPEVCLRMCNLVNALKQFNAFAADIRERFSKIMAERHCNMSVHQENQLDNYHDAVNRTFEDASFELQEFLGVLIVFDDLHHSFLSTCYVPSPADANIDPILGELEEMIEAIKGIVEPDLVPDLVSGMKHSVIKGYERVLLEGGPHRVFLPTDVDVFRRDISSLTAFFAQPPHSHMTVGSIPSGVSVTEPCVRCEEPMLQNPDHNASVFCVECNKNYCQTCDDEIHAGAWLSHQKHTYRLTKKVRYLIELVDLMALPTQDLLELVADPEAAVGRGGVLAHKRWKDDPASLLYQILVHRDDALATAFGERHIEGYDSGGVPRFSAAGEGAIAATRATSAALGKGAQQMGSGIKSIAKLSVKATQKAAASIATSDLDMALDDALDEGGGRGALPREQRDAVDDAKVKMKKWGGSLGNTLGAMRDATQSGVHRAMESVGGRDDDNDAHAAASAAMAAAGKRRGSLFSRNK